jgi:Cu2+-exporting ATPase
MPENITGMRGDHTVVTLGDTDGWVAMFTLDDVVRDDTPQVISALQAAGKRVHLLSGDHAARVRSLAADLGVTHALGDAGPEDKLAYVRALQRDGAVVAMIGDGVNDAPVLAQAQVSAALGGGTQLAQLSADIVLMSDRLAPLLAGVDTARRLARVVRQNLAWAVAYNAVALPLAVTGHVTPLVAAAGMSLSSLTVVLNALRLLSRRAPNTAGARSAMAPKAAPALAENAAS